ncbi:MAG: ABC transporter substrate-binding protein [Lautropia sp.]|nr:ABC transporter substrate-binding protein [Lautropia sp.]
MKKIVVAAVLALLPLALSAQAETIVTDVKGRQVTVPSVPKRVVLGFYYEDYLAVVGPGAMDRVVGLSLATWKDWRPAQYAAYEKALPRLAHLTDVGTTDDNTFSVEKVIAAKPDLLILAAWNYDALGEGVKQIEAAGIPVLTLDYNAQTIEKHVASTLALGKIMGQEKRAQALADNYRKAFADIDARIRRAGPTDKKVYVELAQKGPADVGNSYGDSMWGALITQLGGHNIAQGKIGNWGPLSPEYVLAQKPDLIFLSGSEWLNRPQAVTMGFGASPAVARTRMGAYLKRPGWAGLPAVRNQAVHGIYAGGARTLSDYVYAQYFAKQLYPAAFRDVDPQQNLRDFYEKWLPVKAEGSFMLPYATDKAVHQ